MRGRVDDQRHVVATAGSGDFLERRLTFRRSRVGDGDRAVGDGRLDLPRLGAADPGAGDPLVHAHFDQARTGRAKGVVVAVALLAADDDLIGPAVGIWEALHLCQV